MNAEEIWQAARGELQLEMTRAAFDTWIKPTHLISYQDGEMVIAVPNQYAHEWVTSRLTSTVNRILTGIAGRSMRATFIVWKPPEDASSDSADAPSLASDATEVDWKRFGIPAHFVERDLDNLDWTQPALQHPDLRAYCDQFDDHLKAGIGLLLIGPNGSGKTHIAVGLAKRARLELGYDITFITQKAFLARLRDSYEPGARETEAQIMAQLTQIDLLVLDELRADEINAWSRGKLFDLISRRYDADLPLLATTNLSLNELAYLPDGAIGFDEATLSRMVGIMQVINVSGADYRLVEKRQRLQHLRPGRAQLTAQVSQIASRKE